ncbi:hypothetical protein BS47DRAFT_1365354 [Hydnum rufescens UP504]|uniref:Uncharacterized protein n=1 Tax=Hydnum rufescens UP504 TaxID=1448309 RepID=A0A9P6AP02_9AGAM|nr:hypothetical protein BS47DRAFT_1365354 [Hydnum rufescens UP504]
MSNSILYVDGEFICHCAENPLHSLAVCSRSSNNNGRCSGGVKGHTLDMGGAVFGVSLSQLWSDHYGPQPPSDLAHPLASRMQQPSSTTQILSSPSTQATLSCFSQMPSSLPTQLHDMENSLCVMTREKEAGEKRLQEMEEALHMMTKAKDTSEAKLNHFLADLSFLVQRMSNVGNIE